MGEDVEQLRVQVARLQEQLTEEQELRRRAEAAVEEMGNDRARLQRARDELAAALLAAEKRAADAEEEQLRAEQQAAVLAGELKRAERAVEGGGRGAADAAQQQPPQQEPAGEAQPRRRLRSEEEESDAEVLLAALDQERQRSEELVRLVEAAEGEAVAATERLLKAQKQIEQLKAKGKKGGAAAPLQPTPSASSLAEGEGAEALQQRIAALKASRDKLIGAFDAQASEIERLSTDNAALAESLAQLRDVAGKWEAQAQASLAQNERLKDLLEESATWSIPACGAEDAAAGGAGGSTREAAAAVQAAAVLAEAAAHGGPAGSDAKDAKAGGAALAELCRKFERELLLEKARSAQLDLQVRALAMELTRAAQSSGQMQAALLPMLGGIEARLVQVLGMRPRLAALAGGGAAAL